jgi:hypothetical protein
VSEKFKYTWYLRYDILIAVKMSVLIFWVIVPCGLVGTYQCFFSPEDGDSMFL